MRLSALLFVLLGACSKQPSETSPPHTTEANAPRVDASAKDPAPPAPMASASTPTAEATDAAASPKDEPAPNVKVISIGMHVAGGPFDEETKKPFLKAVEPRYPELARCWNKVTDKSRFGDAGVDLLIPPSGGKPKVSHPRSTVEGEGFLPCIVAFFESVEFDKPKSGGLQGVSYSVRFKPGK